MSHLATEGLVPEQRLRGVVHTALLKWRQRDTVVQAYDAHNLMRTQIEDIHDEA